MGSASSPSGRRRIVVDNIHGDIELSDREWRVVNTASFQRLRGLKQLGMGHFTYPNATHTRFAHSLGVFAIMCRILAQSRLRLPRRDLENLRLAALLHDIGHYPYSHLMELVDRVTLTEDAVDGSGTRTVPTQGENYPEHEELGRLILENQKDLRAAVGGKQRAQDIGALFSRTEAADQQISKLIHSSLDMDRLDYLLRDARAAGVPYGEIDINYLLNNIRVSPQGALGVEYKALAAAEHFLLARLYMHRVVYYHKTTYALEEACRQLLRRVRDVGKYGIAPDGTAIEKMCKGRELSDFTDEYVDRIVRQAVQDEDPVVRALAHCITSRRPPKLLVEVSGLSEKLKPGVTASVFRTNCVARLGALAQRFDLPLGQFLLCSPKPIKIEERGPLFSPEEVRQLIPEEREQLIKVFTSASDEPRPIVEVDDTVITHLAKYQFAICRLYLADLSPKACERLPAIKEEVQSWVNPP